MIKNIFNVTSIPSGGELFETILKNSRVHIERITSSDSVESNEYVQAHDEWVMLLDGQAELKIGNRIMALKKGDHLYIKSGTQHTVVKTAKGTIWLAVHIH